MTYYTNRAAVYFEQKRWDECLKECEQAIEVGRENKADYKFIAKYEFIEFQFAFFLLLNLICLELTLVWPMLKLKRKIMLLL